jgi:hypothetical protein
VVRRGQGVLNVLPLANVRNEIDEAIGVVDLKPRRTPPVAASTA